VEYIPNAPLADMAIVFARTGDEAVSAFLMEKNMSGFSAGESENLMGQRSLPIGELVMNDVRVPARNLLGQEGDGTRMITDCQSRIRVVDAAIALGIARAALEESVRYSNQRVQFGQTLSNFGAIKNKIADMAAGVEAARLLVYQAAVLMDQGKKSEKQSSIAKVFASDLAVEACKEAVQIHGGYGYIKEYPVERLYRDALFTQLHKETNEIQRRDIARLVYNEYK
jgi:alkylation response protein AidB-like acyl-CoA dehydrogenase